MFVYIMQGKMGKTEKNWKENHTTKVPKIPKTKRQKYEMNETKMFMLKPESNCNGRLLKISLN